MLKNLVIAIVVAYALRNLYNEFMKQQRKHGGIFRNGNEEYGHSCPHRSFVRKHLCGNCSSEKDALEISKRRLEFSPTAVNGVVFGDKEEKGEIQ